MGIISICIFSSTHSHINQTNLFPFCSNLEYPHERTLGACSKIKSLDLFHHRLPTCIPFYIFQTMSVTLELFYPFSFVICFLTRCLLFSFKSRIFILFTAETGRRLHSKHWEVYRELEMSTRFYIWNTNGTYLVLPPCSHCWLFIYFMCVWGVVGRVEWVGAL